MSAGAFVAFLVAATLIVGFLTGSVQLVVNVAVSGSIVAVIIGLAVLLDRMDVIDKLRDIYGHRRAPIDELPAETGKEGEESEGASADQGATDASGEQDTG